MPANPPGQNSVTGAVDDFTQPVTFDSTVQLNGVTTAAGAVNLNGTVTVQGAATFALSPVRTSGSAQAFTFNAPADTGQGASAESNPILWTATTVQFATGGTVANQRFFRVRAPTYTSAGTTTLTVATTFAVDAPPTAGSGVTQTDAWAATFGGAVRLAQDAAWGSSRSPLWSVQTIANATNITASTEVNVVSYTTNAVQTWATGALTTQRFFRIQAPTLAFAGASTVTNLANFTVDGAPILGNNTTATNQICAWLDNATYSPSAGVAQSSIKVSPTWTPSAGAITFAGVAIEPTINGTVTSGKATGLAIATLTNTLTNGTINLIDAGTTTSTYASGFAQRFFVSTTGSATFGNQAATTATILTVTGGATAQVVSDYTGGTTLHGFYIKVTGLTAWRINDDASGIVYTAGVGVQRRYHYFSTSNEPTSTLASFNFDAYRNTASTLPVTSNNIFAVGTNGSKLFTVAFDAQTTITQPALTTTGGRPFLVLTGGAHTSLTASTEVLDIQSGTRTVQFATGAITTQRTIQLQGQTYSFVGASTVTDCATLQVTPPIAGVNATFTNTWSVWCTGGLRLDGDIKQTDATKKLGLFNAAPVVQQTIGAVINNVVASGTTGTFGADWTNLTTYSTDAQAIHDSVSQIARSLAQVIVALRAYGLGV